MKQKSTRKRGFTLIEVIAVIIILGVILSITIPSISNVISGSYMQTYEIDLESMENAAKDYLLKENVEIEQGIQTRIELSDLIDAGLIDEIVDPESKEKCDGYVTAVDNAGNYILHSYLKCGDNYQSENYNKTDFVLPIISLLGSNPININVGETYKEPGVIAVDDVDGDITSRVVITGNINPNVSGEYTIVYTVSDNAGNESIPVERTINVVDNEAPIITIETNGNTTYAKTRSTIVRVRDNAVLNTSALKYLWTTNAIAPTEVSFSTTFINGGTISSPAGVTGSYYLWILAKDNSGNTTITGSNVFNLDNTKPVITLNGSVNITIDKGSTYSDAGATATDNINGTLTSNIVTTGSVNPNVVGTYTITYDVSDLVGNAATTVTRTVNVRDILAPVLTLLGSNPVNMDAGTTYSDAGATAVDDTDGNVTSRITITSTVNPNIGGIYTVTYRVVDNAGNVATITRTVNVYVTWYQSRTITPATYYDNYAATGNTTYSCPSGYTSSGSGSSMTCYTTSISYANNIATTDYTCPSGYTASGSGSSTTCTKTEAASSTAATATKYCSDGSTYVASVDKCRVYNDSRVYTCSTGTVNGTNCVVSATATKYCSDGATYVASVDRCRIYTDSRVYTCSTGTVSGTNCVTDATITGCASWNGWLNAVPCTYGYSGCTSGHTYTITSGAGYESEVRCCSNAGVGTQYYRYCGTYSYSCSSGTLSGSNCIIGSATVSCPAGWTMSAADNCYQNTVTPSTSYSCSSGTLSGSNCIIGSATVSCPAGWTMSAQDNCYQNTVTPSTSYSCSSGTLNGSNCYSCSSGTLSGTNCVSTASNIPNTTYSCPSGYTSSGSGSSMTCYTTSTSYASNIPTTTYSCPSGGSLSGTTCYRGYYQCSSGTLNGSSCYGSWSAWTTTPATPSSSLEVNTEKRLSSV